MEKGASTPSIRSGDSAPERPEIPFVETEIDKLIHQVAQCKLTPEKRELATKLAYCLDERGFLAETAGEISSYLGSPADDIGQVVAQLQNMLEPTGVFAWSLQDCFAIQLKAKNRFDPLIAMLLDRMDLISSRNLVAICRTFDVDREDE